MKKYYFKGTNDEINLGDSMTLLIKLKSGKTMKCDTTVDEGTIEDLLKRNSIELKEIVPVQKKVYRTHGKRNPMQKESNNLNNGKRCPMPKESNNGKKGSMQKESNVKVINLNNEERVNEILNVLTDIISGKY